VTRIENKFNQARAYQQKESGQVDLQSVQVHRKWRGEIEESFEAACLQVLEGGAAGRRWRTELMEGWQRWNEEAQEGFGRQWRAAGRMAAAVCAWRR
jgi:hypothetical protein